MEAAKSAARELLIELERHNFSHTNGTAAEAAGGGAGACSSGVGAGVGACASAARPGASALVLEQLDSLRQQLAAETAASAQLREQNARLAADLRALAAQLKQERATGNAVLRAAQQTQRSEFAGEATPRPDAPLGDEALGSSGLTIANAASQILMLRREIKFLQKQWQSARRDADGAARRDEVAALQDTAEREAGRAAEACARAAAAEARQRLLARECSALKAKLTSQQSRIARRSAAQLEVEQLRVQLHTSSEALRAKV